MMKYTRTPVGLATHGSKETQSLMLHGRCAWLDSKRVSSVSRAWEHYRATTPNPVEPRGPIARAGPGSLVAPAKREWMADLPNRLP
eukprot:4140881-Prymnesium_polylepis.1